MDGPGRASEVDVDSILPIGCSTYKLLDGCAQPSHTSKLPQSCAFGRHWSREVKIGSVELEMSAKGGECIEQHKLCHQSHTTALLGLHFVVVVQVAIKSSPSAIAMGKPNFHCVQDKLHYCSLC